MINFTVGGAESSELPSPERHALWRRQPEGEEQGWEEQELPGHHGAEEGQRRAPEEHEQVWIQTDYVIWLSRRKELQ